MKPSILITFFVLVFGLIGCAKPEAETAKTPAHHSDGHVHDATHAHYTCPMHPEVVSEKPGICPKCKMDLELVDESAHVGLHDATKFKMDFVTLPSAISPSQPVVLRFTPKNATDNSLLKNLKIVHEMPMHLLMVSHDLSWYAHEHPEVKPDGSYELAFRFPKADMYHLYADITPEGASHNQVFKLEKAVGQATSGEPNLSPSSSFSADGYVYELRSEPSGLSAGKSATLTIAISKGRKGVTNLENYLGALGHMVIISADREEFLHAHPEEHGHGATSGEHGHGPDVSFMTLFPKAGKYKIWAQFNIDGKVRTAQFVVNVG